MFRFHAASAPFSRNSIGAWTSVIIRRRATVVNANALLPKPGAFLTTPDFGPYRKPLDCRGVLVFGDSLWTLKRPYLRLCGCTFGCSPGPIKNRLNHPRGGRHRRCGR